VISSGLGLMAWQKTIQAELNLADSRTFSSRFLFNEGKELEAFVEAIKAGATLQNQPTDDTEVTKRNACNYSPARVPDAIEGPLASLRAAARHARRSSGCSGGGGGGGVVAWGSGGGGIATLAPLLE
jgi:hypothetical protein